MNKINVRWFVILSLLFLTVCGGDPAPRLEMDLCRVDDVDELVQALGYDLVNVVGGSYGSRSGYVFMKRHLERVRSAFLWSISLVGMHYPSTLAKDTQDSLERLFMDCASDPDCSFDYPDLWQKFEQVLNRLRDGPMGTYRLDQEKRACDSWLIVRLPDDFFRLPPLDIPTLLVSGELDPVNTVRFGQTLADSLPHSLHKVVPNHAHGVDDVWKDCLDEVVVRFISTGSLDGIDISCFDSYRRPPFISWRK